MSAATPPGSPRRRPAVVLARGAAVAPRRRRAPRGRPAPTTRTPGRACSARGRTSRRPGRAARRRCRPRAPGAITTSASASAAAPRVGAARLGRSAGRALEQVVGAGVLGPVALQPAAEHGQQHADAAGRERLEQRTGAGLGRARGVDGDAARRRRPRGSSAPRRRARARPPRGDARTGSCGRSRIATPEPLLDVLDLVPLGHARIRLGDAAHGTSVANPEATHDRPGYDLSPRPGGDVRHCAPPTPAARVRT